MTEYSRTYSNKKQHIDKRRQRNKVHDGPYITQFFNAAEKIKEDYQFQP